MLLLLTLISFTYQSRQIFTDSIIIRPATQSSTYLNPTSLQLEKGTPKTFDRSIYIGPAREGSLAFHKLKYKSDQIGLNEAKNGLRLAKTFDDPERSTNFSLVVLGDGHNRVMINNMCLKNDEQVKLVECPEEGTKYEEMLKFEWLVEKSERAEVLEKCKETMKRERARQKGKKENRESEAQGNKEDDMLGEMCEPQKEKEQQGKVKEGGTKTDTESNVKEPVPAEEGETRPSHDKENKPRYDKENKPSHEKENKPAHERENKPAHERDLEPRHSRDYKPIHDRDLDERDRRPENRNQRTRDQSEHPEKIPKEI